MDANKERIDQAINTLEGFLQGDNTSETDCYSSLDVLTAVAYSAFDLTDRLAALEAALAACQAAPVAAGLTVGEVDLLYDAADALSQGDSSARDVAMGIELQALARRLEAAASEASDGSES